MTLPTQTLSSAGRTGAILAVRTQCRAPARGVVMLFGLIALLIMMIGAVAMLRSTGTSLVNTGNLGFKRDLTNQSERAADLALELMRTGALSTEAARQATSVANNYSATPRTEDEFLAEAHDLQSLIDPDIFPVAEHNGQMVGYWMALPNYNIALKHINGKLDWLGTLKFLWYRRQIDQGRVVLVCSLPEYRRKMVPLALIYLGMQGGIKKGKPYKRAELGHVFESNSASRRLIEAVGGQICKTYRMYEISLSNS